MGDFIRKTGPDPNHNTYGAGEIELEAPEPVHGMKATYDLPGGKSYSLATVARFLGWVKPSGGQATRTGRIVWRWLPFTGR